MNELNDKIPGLVIKQTGEITMMEKNDYHRTFLSKILSKESNINISEDNLAYLTEDLVNEHNYIVYFGCTEGDRVYSEGNFFIPELEKITKDEINCLIDIYSKMSTTYQANIIILKTNQEISIGEIFEESLSKQKTI